MNQPPNRRILLIDDTPSIHDDFRKILMPAVESNEALDEMESGAVWRHQQNPRRKPSSCTRPTAAKKACNCSSPR